MRGSRPLGPADFRAVWVPGLRRQAGFALGYRLKHLRCDAGIEDEITSQVRPQTPPSLLGGEYDSALLRQTGTSSPPPSLLGGASDSAIDVVRSQSCAPPSKLG